MAYRVLRSLSRLLVLSLIVHSAACTVTGSKVEKVREAIDRAGSFPNSEITIDGYQHTITLSGHVSSETDRVLVESAARSVPGITVNNTLTVRSGESRLGSAGGSDPTLQRLLTLIQEDRRIGRHRVTLIRDHGTIVIEGEVDSLRGRERILELASSLPGSPKVETRLTIQRAPSDREILDDIRQALSGNSDTSAFTSNVLVENRVAIVQGTFANHEELDRLLSVLAMIEGLERVENRSTLASSRNANEAYKN